MFSSLASYLFGSNTSDTNSETTATTTTTSIGSGVENILDAVNTVDAENLIEVTSLTPSVTGADDRGSATSAAAAASNSGTIKRGKNRRNNTRQQNKRRGSKNQQAATKSNEKITSKQTTPSDSCDEDFDEDEWYIVEKDEYDVSPPRNDSEGQQTTPIVENVKSVKHNAAPSPLTQQRRLQHINSHSLYSGPRPHKQRNLLQKSRNNNTNTRSSGVSVSPLSPSRTVNDGCAANGPAAELTADGGMTRSLYVAPPSSFSPEKDTSNATNGNGIKKMDESWFVTPPPCFTSIGPINMETSPYENLLIEHPSMSVYHSIRTAQAAAECFLKLDLAEKETKEKRPAKENVPRRNSPAVQQRSSAGFRLDPESVAQLKQELMARSVQKTQSKRERKDIRRSAIKRANKAREVQSKNHTSRRSDRQHCRIVSGANNNRKACF